jgi:TolA-binding protein
MDAWRTFLGPTPVEGTLATMKKLLILVFLLLVAAAALGYWQGWFSVTNEGKVAVAVDSEKFKEDKAAFSKTVGEQAKAMKENVAGLWKKSEGLTGDDKVQAQKELGELEKKRDRLEKQIKDLEDAGEDKFASIQQDLSKTLAEVEKKMEELTKKLDQRKGE